MTPSSETATTLQDEIQTLLRQLTTARATESADGALEHAIAASVLNRSSDAALGLDGGGRLVFANNAACRMFGYDREGLLRLSFLDLIALEHDACIDQWLSNNAAPPISTEARATRQDGVTFPITLTGYSVSHCGQTYRCAVVEDLTGHKETEESRVMCRRALEVTPDHISIVGPDYTYRRVNAAYVRAHGIAESQIVGRPVADLLGHELFEGLVKPQLDRCLAGEDVTYEAWLTFPVSGRKFMHVTHAPLRMLCERIDGVLVTARDITSQREAQEALQHEKLRLEERMSDRTRELQSAYAALRVSEERFRALYEDNPSMYFIVDRSGTVLSVNRFGADQLGYLPHELINRFVYDVFHADDHASIQKALAEAFAQPDRLHRWIFRKMTKDRRLLWVQETVRIIQDPTGLLVALIVCEDITERKLADDKLRELNLALAHAMPGISELDGTGRYIEVNEAYAGMLGYRPEELLGRPAQITVHPDDVPIARTAYEHMRGEGQAETEFRGIRKDGSSFYKHILMVSGSPVGPNPGGYHCFMRDITDRKRAQEQRLQFARIMEASHNEIYIFDAQTLQFHYVNQGAYQNLGYTIDELLQSTPLTINLDLTAAFLLDLSEPLRTGAQSMIAFTSRHRRKDGTTYPVEVHLQLAAFGDRPAYIAIITDITARKAAEDALKASETAIRALYSITSNPKLTFEERVGALLDIGRNRFNLPIAVLTRVGADQVVLEHVRSSLPQIHAGMTLPLNTSFCRHALSREAPIAVTHLAHSEWCTDPAYAALGMECYVGVRVMIGETAYGALGFLSPKPHDELFSQADLEILQLMASWLGTELDRQAAELALRESQELFAVAFRASPHPIVITELLTGRTVEVNDTALAVFGYRREEAIGFTTLALNLWPSIEDRRRFVERIQREGRLRDVDLPFRAKDGRWIQCRLSCEPITLRGVPCVLNVGEDITERKRAESALRESEERFRSLFEEAPVGMCIVGSDLRMRKVNSAFLKLVGYDEVEILANTYELYTHADDLPNNVALSHRFLNGEIPGYTYEKRYIRKNGEIIWVTVTVSSLGFSDGSERVSLAIVQDVTARKSAEQALANRERDLRAALEEREQVSQDLHDGILQSLYAVGLSLDAASRLMDVSSRRARRELAGAISQLNRTLQEIRSFITGLSFDMLDVTRFTHALQSVSDAFCKSGRTSCEISAAPEAVKRLTRHQCVHLLNIVREAVSNSVRHGRASCIRVNLRRHRGQTRLTIRDNGKGFDPHADLRRGYGLRNMRSRSLKMHAKFTVQSKPDAGTTITLALAPEESHV